MGYKNIKIKNGITFHEIDTDKFKTNIVAVFFTIAIDRKNITKKALITEILRRGTEKIRKKKEINEYLEEMYGANFNCGIEKRGDNQILKFYVETIDDSYSLNNEENLLEKSIKLIIDITLNPLVKENKFNKEYVEKKKENLRKIINSKIDNKSIYSYIRCVEEMYKKKPFSLYEYGYEEDLKEINETNLYEYYKELISNCKINIIISRKLNNDIVEKILFQNELIKNLNERNACYIQNSIKEIQTEAPKEVKDVMDVSQGKLILGISSKNKKPNIAIINIYNAILGEGANSKLFQNVREKASLAYTASSIYIKMKNAIFIRAGIKLENYEKALKIIEKQFEDMKNGVFLKKDLEAAKEIVTANLMGILDEQATEVSYMLSQELTDNKKEISELIEDIKKVTMEDVVSVAKDLEVNTIYFLTNK